MRFDTEKMRDRMDELELTQADLARMMGVSRQNIFNYLDGKILKFQTVERLANVLRLKGIDLIIED